MSVAKILKVRRQHDALPQVDYDLRVAQRVIGAEVDRRVQRHAA